MTKRHILIILALSFATHFAFFSVPAETVFDEVHFGKFVSGYFSGEYFFDIHPPLGKLLIAGVAKISGFQPGFSFETIGQKFTDDAYKWLRFLPKLAGALLPVVIFLIALELLVEGSAAQRHFESQNGAGRSGIVVGISQKFAFLAGLLLVFENSLLAQSRFMLLDSFLLLFGFLGILCYLKAKIYNLKSIWLFLAGFFAVLAASIKWTGLSFLAIIMIFYILETFKYTAAASRLKFLLKGLFALVVIPVLIYFSIFVVHFSLLDKPGPGNAFHPPNFQQMNVFEKFIELNAEIYQSNARLSATHPYSSQWYKWPFMNRPIYYWNGSTNTSQVDSARIYFLGNPLIYWLSTLAVIYFLINSFKNRKKISYSLLLIGYLLNLLPFILIGRVMFLYHYMTALIFAILMLAYFLEKAEFPRKKLVFNAILASSVILFLFFSPLTYGLEIPDWYYQLTIWVPSWR